MGEGRSGQDALFCEFSLEHYVPAEQLLRSIDRFVDLAAPLVSAILAAIRQTSLDLRREQSDARRTRP